MEGGRKADNGLEIVLAILATYLLRYAPDNNGT